MAKFYRVNRDGLTVGTTVFRSGQVIEVDAENPNLSRASRAFMREVERTGGHEFLDPVDGRSSEAKRNTVSLPGTTTTSGLAKEDAKSASEPEPKPEPEPEPKTPEPVAEEEPKTAKANSKGEEDKK